MFSIVSKAFWRNKSNRLLVIIGTVLGIAYPFAVYYMLGRVSPRSFVLLAIIILCLRVLTMRSPTVQPWRIPLVVVAVLLIAVNLINADIAVKAYPVLMGLAGAFVFGWSLRHPPSLIERIARLRGHDLPPYATAYCRKVTAVWAIWMVMNASIAAGLGAWGSLAAWTLWTGLLSYFAMGFLFVSEIAVRHVLLALRANR